MLSVRCRWTFESCSLIAHKCVSYKYWALPSLMITAYVQTVQWATFELQSVSISGCHVWYAFMHWLSSDPFSPVIFRIAVLLWQCLTSQLMSCYGGNFQCYISISWKQCHKMTGFIVIEVSTILYIIVNFWMCQWYWYNVRGSLRAKHSVIRLLLSSLELNYPKLVYFNVKR